MRNWKAAAPTLMLMAAVWLAAGCGDDSTEPDDTVHAPGEHLWSARFGDAGAQVGNAVAVDAFENVIVAGNFEGTIDFGGGPLVSVVDRSFFVVKFGPDGAHLWSRAFGNTVDQIDPNLAVDGAGNVYLAGRLVGAFDFGGGPLVHAGDGDAFIAKFTADGAHVWSRRFGDGNPQSTYALDVDDSGQVILAGLLWGTADFGGGPLTSAGEGDVFIARFDSDGTHIWSRRSGDASNQFPTSVAVDHSGNVVVTGAFRGSADFGGGVLTSAGDYDYFVVKFGLAGEHLWSRRFGDAGMQLEVFAAVDEPGNIILAGGFLGGVDFGGGLLTSAGGADAFVARLGSGGDHHWSARFGGPEEWQSALAVAADASGNAIIAGVLWGTADFGGGLLTGAGEGDLFVAKFGPDGLPAWSRRFGDAEDQYAFGVAVGASGNVSLTGDFMGVVDFGGGALTSAGSYDACVVTLAP